ncbi:MAG: tetratricopeptide repeat protein, partial [Candidatus Edwardsbacteria bacterium]|nr:tetratricopeptide repeat protein [Candidatus Edwardsbacteria bacterium]
RCNYDSALNDFNKALMLEPNNADILYNRGQALYFLGDLKQAHDVFVKAASLGNENAKETLRIQFPKELYP